MKLLVFGSGFIAENFIDSFKSLYADKCEVVVLYNRHQVVNTGVLQYNMNDIAINKVLTDFQPDYIVCFQGNSFVSDNNKVHQAIQNNVLKTSSLLESLEENNIYKSIKKILIIGSAGEYGKLYNEPIKEEIALIPNSLYGLSKALLYEVFKYYVRKGFPLVYIRQFNTIGIGQQEKFVLPSFVKQIVKMEKKQQEKVIEVGDLTQERDFIDIRDTCSAYNLLLRKGKIGETYNVASGVYLSVEELLNKIIEQSTISKESLQIHSDVNMFHSNDSLSKRLYADIEKLKQLGFKLKHTIDDTIYENLTYWRKNV